MRVLLISITCALTATAYGASPVVDDVNDGQSPGLFVFAAGLDNVGWQYTPETSYTLDGITSTFRQIPNPPVATRDVTLGVYSSFPIAGDPPLRSGTFEAGASGGNLGVEFEGLELTAGENYFIGLSGVDGLGLNIVDFDLSLPPPDFAQNPDIDFLSGWYTGVSFETFNSVDESAGFAAPILRLHGVPEPGCTLLCLIGSVAMMLANRRTE